LVELRDALAIVVREFEVDDWIHEVLLWVGG
jgi:hypothetical protein